MSMSPTVPRATSPQPVTDETLSALIAELVRLRVRRDTMTSTTTLDASAFRILWVLVKHGPRTLRGVAEELQLEQSTINRQVHSAVGHGWVERFDSPDCASMQLRATAAGERAYRSESASRAASLRGVVDTLGEEVVSDLAASMALLNDAIDGATDTSRGSAT